jgi:hypothetical protein
MEWARSGSCSTHVCIRRRGRKNVVKNERRTRSDVGVGDEHARSAAQKRSNARRDIAVVLWATHT